MIRPSLGVWGHLFFRDRGLKSYFFGVKQDCGLVFWSPWVRVLGGVWAGTVLAVELELWSPLTGWSGWGAACWL